MNELIASVIDCDTSCQLDRIVDAMTGFDWNTFWATLIATIIGALVAAFVGLAVARAERPKPLFRADVQFPHGIPDFLGTLQVGVKISNIGDGPAYNVASSVTGGITEPEVVHVPKLESGTTTSAAVVVRVTGREFHDPTTLEVSDTRKVYWPANATAVLTWHQAPRLRRTHTQRFPLANPFVGTPWDGSVEP